MPADITDEQTSTIHEASPSPRPFGLAFLTDVLDAMEKSRRDPPRTGSAPSAVSLRAEQNHKGASISMPRGDRKNTVLIIADTRDPGARAVFDHLQTLGIRCVRLDSSLFPTAMTCTFTYPAGAPSRYALRIAGTEIRLCDLAAVWYQSMFTPTPASYLGDLDMQFAAREARHALGSLPYLTAQVRWINPVDKLTAAGHKPYQLAVAADLGFKLPRTIITNNFEDAVDFISAVDGPVIYKSLVNYSRSERGRGFGLYTTLLDRKDLVSRRDDIAVAPCIFQERIRKLFDVRIVVIGDRLFTVNIHSQDRSWAALDWRIGDIMTLRMQPADLPDDIALKVRAFMRRMGLWFGCLDMIIQPDGTYVFLEINPNGQWLWIQECTGLPLLEEFTNLLLTPAI